MVFVVGNALSVSTLAKIARDAGAVRALGLDINKAWTNFMTYSHPSPGAAVPHMLAARGQRGAWWWAATARPTTSSSSECRRLELRSIR